MISKYNPILVFVCVCISFSNLAGQTLDADFNQWLFPENSWKDEDFQNRFLGRYGVNGYIEPQMDVDNYNIYESTMALIEHKQQAIAFLNEGIASLDSSGVLASASLYFILASLHYEEGEMQQAIENYTIAIQRHPNFLRAYANLGFTLMEVGESEKALPVLLKVVELGGNESQVHGLIGHIYSSKKLYESGLTSYRNALVFNPENNNWRFGAMECLIGLGRYDQATTLADEILAFDRNNPSNWINRAGLLYRLERWDEAIVEFETAHALGGATFQTHLTLAALYFNKRIYNRAQESVASASRLSDDAEDLNKSLSYALTFAKAGEIERALELVSVVKLQASKYGIALNQSPIDRINLAAALDAQSYEEVLSIVDTLISRDPSDGELQTMKAESLAALGRIEEAILAYQIAVTFEETAYKANYEYARLELSRGEVQSAIALLKVAYSKRPSESLKDHISELEAFLANR